MQNLTPEGQQLVNNLCNQYNLSYDAIMHMLIAVNNGGSSMAQFNSPELGGSGQWMRGGMTMVGDMFNNGLKMTVDNLCNDLANGLSNMQVFVPVSANSPASNQWWPGDLGQPFSSGAQNNLRYAVFPNRLAVDINGSVTVYNTLDNNISGVSQQQGSDNSLTFSSQYGTISVASLPIVSGAGTPPAMQQNFAEPLQSFNQSNYPQSVQQEQPVLTNPSNTNSSNTASYSIDECIQLIEKLSKLRDIGAISDNEFNTKKAELLNRI